MKLKQIIAVLLPLCLLLGLSGCAEGEETSPSGAPGLTQQGDSYQATDLVIQQENGEEMVFFWTGSQENDIQYVYRVLRENLTDDLYRDAAGNPADPALFTPGTPVTLVFHQVPTNSGYGQIGGVETMRYLLDQDTLAEIRLTESDQRQVLTPFADLTAEVLAGIQFQTDRMDPPGFSDMSEAAVVQTVQYLNALSATVQTQPGAANEVTATPTVLKILGSDGGETILDFTGGENYQLTITSGENSAYYALRYQAYQPIVELVLRQRTQGG